MRREEKKILNILSYGTYVCMIIQSIRFYVSYNLNHDFIEIVLKESTTDLVRNETYIFYRFYV